MKCETITEDLQAYLDNELQDARRNEIEAHLHECNDCMLMVGELKDVSGMMQNWEVPEPILPTGQQLLGMSAPRRGFILRGLQWFYDLPFKVRAPIFTAAAALIICLVLINYTSLERMSSAPAPTISERAMKQEAETSKPIISELVEKKSAPVTEPAYVQPARSRADDKADRKNFLDETGRVDSKVAAQPAAPPASHNAYLGSKNKETAIGDINTSSGTEGKLEEEREYAPLKLKKSPNAPREQLIIKSAQLGIETEKFDESKNHAAELANAKGGYITKLQVSTQPGGRVAEVIMKVPSRNFEQMVSELRKFGKVTQELVEGQDVSDRFYEVTDEIESETNQEKDVKEIIAKNPGNIRTKMEAQRELDAIRRQRQELEREREQMREGANLSTITLNLKERLAGSQVDENGTPSIGQQIKTAFGNGVTNLGLLVLPIILFIGEAGLSLIVIFAFFYLVYRLGRRYVRKQSAYDWTRNY